MFVELVLLGRHQAFESPLTIGSKFYKGATILIMSVKSLN